MDSAGIIADNTGHSKFGIYALRELRNKVKYAKNARKIRESEKNGAE